MLLEFIFLLKVTVEGSRTVRRHPTLEPKQTVAFVEENDPDSGARWTLLRGERQEDPGLRVHTSPGIWLSSSTDTAHLSEIWCGFFPQFWLALGVDTVNSHVAEGLCSQVASGVWTGGKEAAVTCHRWGGCFKGKCQYLHLWIYKKIRQILLSVSWVCWQVALSYPPQEEDDRCECHQFTAERDLREVPSICSRLGTNGCFPRQGIPYCFYNTARFLPVINTWAGGLKRHLCSPSQKKTTFHYLILPDTGNPWD